MRTWLPLLRLAFSLPFGGGLIASALLALMS